MKFPKYLSQEGKEGETQIAVPLKRSVYNLLPYYLRPSSSTVYVLSHDMKKWLKNYMKKIECGHCSYLCFKSLQSSV